MSGLNSQLRAVAVHSHLPRCSSLLVDVWSAGLALYARLVSHGYFNASAYIDIAAAMQQQYAKYLKDPVRWPPLRSTFMCRYAF